MFAWTNKCDMAIYCVDICRIPLRYHFDDGGEKITQTHMLKYITCIFIQVLKRPDCLCTSHWFSDVSSGGYIKFSAVDKTAIYVLCAQMAQSRNFIDFRRLPYTLEISLSLRLAKSIFGFACDRYLLEHSERNSHGKPNFSSPIVFFFLIEKKFFIQKNNFEDAMRRSDVSLFLLFLAVSRVHRHFFRVHNLNFSSPTWKYRFEIESAFARRRKNRIKQHLNSIYSE